MPSPSSTATERYYVHGDEHEVETGIYYCASCGRFGQAQHFYRDCNRLDHHNHYLKSLNQWLEARWNGVNKIRPMNAPNFWS